MNSLDRILEILRKIAPSTNAQKPSSLKLLQEFLRREMLWSRALGIYVSGRAAGAFYDLSFAVSPQIRCPDQILNSVDLLPFSSGELRLVHRMLHWVFLERVDGSLKDHFELPAPYEPLLLFFEDGGRFFVEHGESLELCGLGGLSYKAFERRLLAGAIDVPFMHV